MQIETQALNYLIHPSVHKPVRQIDDLGLDIKAMSLENLRTGLDNKYFEDIDHENLQNAMDITRKRLQGTGINIRLAVEAKNRIQLEVFRPDTNEVIRKFPPDEIIRLAEAIDELNGIIYDGKY